MGFLPVEFLAPSCCGKAKQEPELFRDLLRTARNKWVMGGTLGGGNSTDQDLFILFIVEAFSIVFPN